MPYTLGMNNPIYKIKVDLNSVPEDGMNLSYSQEDGEFAANLKDLIGDNAFTVNYSIQALGNVFKIEGVVTTKTVLDCSRCGEDVMYPLNLKVDELLMVEDNSPRGSKHSKSQSSEQWTENGPFCNHLESAQFDLSEFTHEIIASNLPYVVECKNTKDCEDFIKTRMKLSTTEEEESTSNPFDVLQNFNSGH